MTPDAAAFNHISVLSHELMAGLILSEQGLYLDATVGGGGHSALILSQCPQAQIIALDQDIQALDAARAQLHDMCDRIQFRFHPCGEIRF